MSALQPDPRERRGAGQVDEHAGSTRAPRVTWLDGIRGAAAVFVVLHHMWLATWPGYPRDLGPSWLGWLLYGHMAVAVFIVVSGFSLALAPLRKGGTLQGGVSRFIRRRAWRILPPYWAALVLSVVVMAAVVDPATFDGPTIARSVAVHGTLLQDVVGSQTPNGAFWSIAIEWQIYFLFPVVLVVGRRFGMGIAALAAGAVVVLAHAVAQLGSAASKLDDLTPQFFALFVLGVLAAELGMRAGAARARRPLAAAGAVALCAFLVIAHTQGSPWMVANYFWVDLLFGIGTACLLGVLSCGGAPIAQRALGSRLGRRFGSFSYSIYLVHAPVLALMVTFVVRPLSLPPLVGFGALLLVGLPTILAFAYGFHLIFEAPFIRHRNWTALGIRFRAKRLRRHLAAESGMPMSDAG
jgi:peptidoglycan/LPS O-acetylase OafA/YrhL